jgi:hypothetical protein
MPALPFLPHMSAGLSVHENLLRKAQIRGHNFRCHTQDLTGRQSMALCRSPHHSCDQETNNHAKAPTATRRDYRSGHAKSRLTAVAEPSAHPALSIH